ncbi:LLM class flavin-dependent oxidoreductase [Caballeronia sp. LjRoot34]|uniref:LLM class flavin-dependent oxidoreductase n=1 Tax=Caballeronia sp. LjRoot34 TaxID=3342325 RepID=UPI003ED04601
MNVPRRHMHFLAFCEHGIINHAIGTWRHPRDKVGYDFTLPEYWQDLGRTLERGLFDAIFLADELAPYNVYRGAVDDSIRYAAQCPVHDPATLVPVIGLATTRLGIGLTQTTTFEHPYTLCRRLSTLDHLTRGRVGWNIVTSYSSSEFQAMGLSDVVPRTERYARLEEFMEVCYALWDSWAPDAIVADVATGIYADPDKVKKVAHAGKYFRCHGPSFVHRSPQGRPVLWQAGSSEAGRAFAARHAEAVFSIQSTPTSMRAYVDDIRSRAATASRNAGGPRIYLGVQIVLGETHASAVEKLEALKANIHIDGALAKLSGDIGYDFSQLALDDELIDIDVPGIRGQFDALRGIKGGQPVTLREAAEVYSISLAAPLLVGTAAEVADELEHLMDVAGNDGFMLLGTYMPGCFREFVDDVVPILQRRNRYRSNYPGVTLRENMLQD